MKPNAVIVIAVVPDAWTVCTEDTRKKLNFSVKDKKAAEKIAKILNDEIEANNIVWAE